MTGREWIGSTPTWIFDLDGTLTVARHDFAALRRQLGLSDDDDILSVFDKATPSRADALKRMISDWEWAQVPGTQAANGARQLLDKLSQQGCNLAILTRNLRDIAFATLDEIGCRDYFQDDHVLGREEAEAKPSPKGIYRCLDLMETRLPAIMVGDYIYDVQAGRAAGCRTILTSSTFEPEWLTYVDLHVHELAELL